jgi:hypothetical protein
VVALPLKVSLHALVIDNIVGVQLIEVTIEKDT